MTKIINYDFAVDTLITVEAPVGTDPSMLVTKALEKLSVQAAHEQVVIAFQTTFDLETGEYSEEWEEVENE
tara:strand:- start:654 stop:866 length:213 start_codon:yes stop_codon:yes gene_type:complete